MTARHSFMALIASLILVIGTASAPAFAHKGHHKKPVAEEQAATQGSASQSNAAIASPTAMDGDRPVDRSEMSTMARLLDWLGRLHPIIVHFPIAFFPAALFTAIVGRRRPAFAEPVRFLVMAGGIIAPVAALLGWLDAGFDPASDDWLLQTHRWLGSGFAVAALGLGLWAWRRPDQVRSRGMLVALIAVTAVIVVQGWFGGAMVHGADHMNW